MDWGWENDIDTTGLVSQQTTWASPPPQTKAAAHRGLLVLFGLASLAEDARQPEQPEQPQLVAPPNLVGMTADQGDAIERVLNNAAIVVYESIPNNQQSNDYQFRRNLEAIS